MKKHYLSPNVQALIVLILILCFFFALILGNRLSGEVPSHFMYTPLLLYANMIAISSALHPKGLKNYLLKTSVIWTISNAIIVLIIYFLDPKIFDAEISSTLANLNLLVLFNLYLFMALLLATFFRFLTQVLEDQ